MPIPYDQGDTWEELGMAAFLSLATGDPYGPPESAQQVYYGALFLINARGEPVEFTYNRAASRHPWLWGPPGPQRHAQRKLTASLLHACPRAPRLLLCLAAETGAELFGQDLLLQLPVVRLGEADAATQWFPEQPTQEAAAGRMWRHLQEYGLLREPFRRAREGLQEVYGSGVPASAVGDARSRAAEDSSGSKKWQPEGANDR